MSNVILSVVIPCFNEEKNIPQLVKRFEDVISRNDIEIIFVNNGSTDNSKTVLNDALQNISFAKVVTVEKNKGYGYGIISGLKQAKGKYIGWTHADLQTDPIDVIKALEIIEKSNQSKIFVKGNRKNRPFLDNIFTIGMSCFETILMKKLLFDINAQPNIFSRELFDNWQNPPYDFALDLFALYEAKKCGYEIYRFPVIFPKRIYGFSSWNTGIKAKIKFIKRTIEYSFELKNKIIRKY